MKTEEEKKDEWHNQNDRCTNPPVWNDELKSEIVRAVSRALCVDADDVSFLENADKYHERAAPNRRTRRTEEVFELMRRLNEMGLADPTLGLDAGGRGRSFRRALAAAADAVARHARGRPVRYVELGPEPVKTSFVLAGLRERGVDLVGYLGVDVNPTSPEAMAPYLAKHLPAEKIEFCIRRYDELGSLKCIYDDDAVNVVTMLGFEEGNEHPLSLHALLGRLLGPRDLLLSEMQLITDGDQSGSCGPIADFYDLEPMRRFSHVCLEASHGPLRTERRADVLPIDLTGVGEVQVAVVTERIVDPNHQDGGNSRMVVTNHCLKYDGPTFRRIRTHEGTFQVLAQETTGDGSIAFQLAERTSRTHSPLGKPQVNKRVRSTSCRAEAPPPLEPKDVVATVDPS